MEVRNEKGRTLMKERVRGKKKCGEKEISEERLIEK